MYKASVFFIRNLNWSFAVRAGVSAGKAQIKQKSFAGRKLVCVEIDKIRLYVMFWLQAETL